jgi:hypothetical protein
MWVFFAFGARFLSRVSTLRSLVTSLRLRTPFMRMAMKALKTPNGFLGALPCPEIGVKW